MKYEKLIPNEEGYLLMESLFTLLILIAITVMVYPLAINWLSTYREAKLAVEDNRILYEHSLLLKDDSVSIKIEEECTVESSPNQIRIEETGTGVVIYESIFEKE